VRSVQLMILEFQRKKLRIEMNHVDLFCGPGGFATGFEWAGFKTILGLDIHEPSLKTFQKNHKHAKTILGDIREISDEDMVSMIGKPVDVLSAGVPCEGFSMANRNRTKFTDERNFLFVEFLRMSELLQPKVLLVENVANFARHDDGFFGKEVEAGMKDLGYETTSTILNACDFGVPQRRRRVMFLGIKPGFAFRWPNPTHGSSSGLKPFVTVGDALLGDLPPLNAKEFSDKYSGPPTNDYQEFLREGATTLLNHHAPNHPKETIERIARTKPGEPMYETFKQRIRLHKDKLSPTIVSGGIRPQFAYGHPTQPRGMSIRERARLMSFPDRYDFVGGIVQGRVQTGDAVPPLLAKAVAMAIKEALNMEVKSKHSDLGKVHVTLVAEKLRNESKSQLSFDFEASAHVAHP
jgi:DNA (cytosine-5)-methyltransferase 1